MFIPEVSVYPGGGSSLGSPSSSTGMMRLFSIFGRGEDQLTRTHVEMKEDQDLYFRCCLRSFHRDRDM